MDGLPSILAQIAATVEQAAFRGTLRAIQEAGVYLGSGRKSDSADPHAIAAELHRLLRHMDDVQMDAAHMIRTVPLEEIKRRGREQMRREAAEAKRQRTPSK